MKSAWAIIVLGILGMSAGASRAWGQTSFRFAIWGGSRGISSGVDEPVLTNISNQVNGLSPKPVFTLFQGDLCYSFDSTCTSTGSSGWKYGVNDGSPGNGLFNITFALEGNHDDNSSAWDTYWNGHAKALVTTLGGSNFNFYSGDSQNRTYSFDYSNAHFCMMDNQGGAASTLSSGQISWLDSDIAAAEARGVTHTFIMTHGPIWYINEETDTPSSAMIKVINKHPSISACIAGHEHVLGYAHIDSSRIPGLTHPFEEFVNAGAGAPLFSCTAGRSEYCTSNYGLGTVDVSGNNFTYSIYLQGAGSNPAETWTFTKSTAAFTLSPTSVSFGNQSVGTSSAAQAVTVTNGTSSSVSISSIGVSGTNSGDFSQTNDCGSSLAAGASCTVDVTFTPAATGTRTASLAVTDSAAGSPQTVSLSGTGVTNTAGVSPASLTFGGQIVGTTSAAQTSTLTNTGTISVSISSIAVSGDFAQTNNCGGSLAAGGSCTISVTFTPTATGTRTGTVTVTDSATNSPQTIDLTGTGAAPTAPVVSFSLSALSFGTQTANTTTPAQAVTLTNTGTASLSISGISISGTNSGDFAQTNNCGASVAVGANCTINVTFTPTALGTRNAAVAVADNAAGNPQTVSLTGTGATASGGTAPSLVQVQNNIDTSGTAFTSFSVNITTQPGSLLVAFCRESSNGTDNFTVTDSAGQTWALTSSGYKNESSTGPRVGMFYVPNSAVVANVTVQYTTAGGVIKPGIMVYEISGAAASAVADGAVNNASGASVTTSSSGALTTTALNGSDILIFATDAAGNETDWTAGAGYTIPNNLVTPGASGSNIRQAMQYAVVSSAQTNVMTSTTYPSTQWNGNIFAAFAGAPGTGGGAGTVSLAPTALSFSSQPMGSASAAQVVALQNTTGSSITVSSIAITGTNSVDFNETNNCGAALAAGASCSIDITFIPSTVGTESATLTVSDTATNSPQTATLSGTGAPPSVTLTPSSLTFDGQNTGTTSASQALTLTNSQSTALGISSIAISGTNGSSFAQTNNCGTSLAASSTCTINVTFTPAATGSLSATLAVTDNATNSPQMAGLSGTGTAPAVGLIPPSLTFGGQMVGTTATAQVVTLTNTGTGPLTITGISITGTNAGDFAQTNNCPISPATLAANTDCAINITFTPTATGARSASLSVNDNASGSPQTVGLTGTGTASAVGFSPASLTFSGQLVGTTSPAQTSTLTNSGTAALTISSIAITGTNSGDFAQTNTCPVSPSTLAVGGSCTISVTFAPTATGTRTAAVTVSDDATGSPQNLPLSGTGTAPVVSLSATSLTYSKTSVGASKTKSLTLTNSGTGTLLISSIAISGTNSGDFSQTNTCGSSVAAGGSCTINVTFTPTATGTRTASLAITDNAGNSPQQVSLSGTGR